MGPIIREHEDDRSSSFWMVMMRNNFSGTVEQNIVVLKKSLTEGLEDFVNIVIMSSLVVSDVATRCVVMPAAQWAIIWRIVLINFLNSP